MFSSDISSHLTIGKEERRGYVIHCKINKHVITTLMISESFLKPTEDVNIIISCSIHVKENVTVSVQ
jgi:hypothetical protein